MIFTPLDIETEGLNSPEHQVVSICLGDKVCAQDCKDVTEKTVLKVLTAWVHSRKPGTVIVTFNGGSFYNPGFDFPFLRTRYAINNLRWPFAGVKNVDIYPIIQKRFNTAVSIPPTLEEFTVDELKIMVTALTGNPAPKSLKAVIINGIKDNFGDDIISEYLTKFGTPKRKDINDLKGAHEILTGIPGDEKNGLWSVNAWLQYKETGNPMILDQIREYNKADCDKTLELFEIIRTMVSSRDIKPEVL